jgi:LmbE family N-acetylglucosaminyl deacetylase
VSALLISPHLDDATLSCAGAVTRLVAAGEDVTVVTVCKADDESGDRATRLARRSHASWRARSSACGRSHPPPHAGCPRGDPGPLPVLI